MAAVQVRVTVLSPAVLAAAKTPIVGTVASRVIVSEKVL